MAAAQNLELTLDMVVKNQGAIATLFKQIGKLKEQVEKLEDATGGAEDAVRKMGKTVRGGTNPIDALSKSARRNRQAMQMAGMQIGDFATQVSTGSNPVQAFNQQLGQLGYALSTSAKPRLAAVGNFLAGPWSIAVLGATMILGPMIENMLGLGDAADETKGAMVDIERAMDFAAMTIDQVTEATNLLKKANEDFAAQSSKTVDGIAAIAKANLDLAESELAAAKAALSKRSVYSEMGTTPGAAVIGADQDMNIGALKAEIEVLEGALGPLQERFRGAQANLIRYRMETDRATQLQKDLNTSLQIAEEAYAAGSMDLKEYRRTVEAVNQTYQPMIEAAKESAKGTRGSAAAQREANEALRKALKLEKQMIEANVARASSLAKLTETMKKWEEQTEPKGQKPKTYQEVLATLEKIETLEIKTPKGLQDIIDKNAEVRSSFEAIGNAVANGFKGMITGAQSFGSAMKNVIQSVIDELFRLYVVQQIVGFVTSALGGVFGTGAQSTGSTGRIGGFRALGGSVSANTPYVVGEKGPELFMPSKSGTIIPNQNLPSGGGGGSTFNISVDARGSSDPEAVRQQVQQGILEAAPSIVAAAQNRTINTLRRPRLAGAL